MKAVRRTLKYSFLIVVIFAGIVILAVIGLFVATQGDHTVPATVTTDATIPSIEIDGLTFHAETYGDPQDPVVIVVHGGPGGDFGYLLNLHELEDEYFVVFYDQRGAGLSPRVPADELTLQTSIDDLHRLVQQYGQSAPVRLIGHSWGGMLVAAYVGQYPEFAVQAVLAEPGALTNQGLRQFLDRQANGRGPSYYRTLIPTVFESMHLALPDEEARLDYIYGQMTRQFVGSDAAGYECASPAAEPALPQVTIPPSRYGATAYSALFEDPVDLSPIVENAANYPNELLFLASVCSQHTGTALQEAHMELFPRAKLAIISNAGHNMITENPAESLAAIRDYFE